MRSTKAASAAIERSRLEIERLDRLSWVSVEVMDVEADGKMRLEWSIGDVGMLELVFGRAVHPDAVFSPAECACGRDRGKCEMPLLAEARR